MTSPFDKWFRFRNATEGEKDALKPVRIRAAAVGDVDSVMALILPDSEKGHYSPGVAADPAAFSRGVRHAFESGQYLYINQHGETIATTHRSYVAVASSGGVIGFVLAAGARSEAGEIAIEGLMLSVAPSARRQGLGTRLVEASLAEVPPGVKVVARYLPRSVAAMGALDQMGFVETERTHEGSVHLSLDRR